MELANRTQPRRMLVLSERLASRIETDRIVRSLDDGVTFETKHLHEYCFRTATPLSHDVALLLGAVRLADRTFTRHHSRSWARTLDIELPVHSLQDWRRLEVASTLKDCLDYLTGDDWRFTFVKRRRKSAAVGQVHLLSAPTVPRIFVPFSHGLDSHAQCVILASKQAVEIVRVNVNANRKPSDWRSLGRRGRSHAIPVSSQVDEPHHPEPSFRTRAFIFDLMAAYGAAISESGRVLVPENGQGSLGGSLVPLGNEAPHRSCHPGFTSRLASFVLALTGQELRFEHPALFLTKGQVLRKLADLRPASDAWLSEHFSCSYDMRHAHTDGRLVHCGLCGNCLLRRMSLHAGEVTDSTEYLARNIRAQSLEAAFVGPQLPRELRSYRDVTLNAARGMQRLAELALTPDSARVWAEIDGLARYQGRSIQDTKADMQSFLQQHHDEWTAFLTDCGKTSWVSQLARG